MNHNLISMFQDIYNFNFSRDFWSRSVMGRDLDDIFTDISPAVMADPKAKEALTDVIIAVSDMHMICKKLKENPYFVRHDRFYNDLEVLCRQYIRLCDRKKFKDE